MTPASRTPADILKDREGRAVADLLTRFRNLVTLAAMPEDEGETKEKGDKGAIKEIAASHAFQMEVESNALVQAAEDLLKLSRELKEMWLAGPLREIGEDEEDDKMGEDAKVVGEMVNAILQSASELKTGATIALQ